MAESRYQQVMRTLRERIEHGEYQVGDRLPSETELAAALGVSRPTLRQALARLESEGLLRRIKGSGTFVSQPKLLHESTSFLAGYYQEAEQHHRTLRTEVIALDIQRAGSLGSKLGLPESAKLTRLVRRRRVEGFDNGKPVVYDQLEERGLKICHASRVLEVVHPAPEISAALELSPFEPVVYVVSTGIDARGRCIEYAQSYYPAGSSRFLVEIDQ